MNPNPAPQNYSYLTSLPAYKENQSEKELQKKKILSAMVSLGGKACLLQLAEKLELPQSTVSGRMSDLRVDRRVCDTGDYIEFKGRKRKEFSVIQETVATSKAPIATSFFE